jgi:hypothetical protein
VSECLYNTKDTTRVRELLLKEQLGNCLVTGLPIPAKQAVLDHSHDSSQAARGVLHRQINAFVGKCENSYIRLIAWWYTGTLPQLLRQVADYLEDTERQEVRFVHPSWTKKIQTMFNGLKEPQKDVVLQSLRVSNLLNGKARKEAFREIVLSRTQNYSELRDLILKEKNRC